MGRLLGFGVMLGAFAGCYLSSGDNGGGGPPGSGIYDGGGGSAPSDLPCDVANALVMCQSCHGPMPTGGAPMSLASRADLMAQSAQYPGQTEAQRAVVRMQGTPTQMPPPPASTSPQSDVDAINAWITAGYPAGTCGTSQTVCTSGKTGATGESKSMRPGEKCIACHQSTGGEAPLYAFMGTLYPTLHEPDDCVGATSTSYGGAQIVVVDANGNPYTMTPNSGGNFMGSASGFTMPFTAKVLYQGREIDMITPQTSGDCNSCHTEQGANGAPGRIVLP